MNQSEKEIEAMRTIKFVLHTAAAALALYIVTFLIFM